MPSGQLLLSRMVAAFLQFCGFHERWGGVQHTVIGSGAALLRRVSLW